MPRTGVSPVRRELEEKLRRRLANIIQELKKQFPNAVVALRHSNPLQLLVATILSAQCTDERVNKVTPQLFKKYKTASEYASVDQKVLEQEIHSTGFFRAKARNIIGCCKMLVEKHGSKVPRTMDDLVALPGVGRKTANVILGSAYGVIEGIVVDTHVKRLSHRLGFSTQSDPEKVERDLMEIVPKKQWIDVGHLLILHGRKTCNARKPKCVECTINELCPSAELYLTAEGKA